MRIKIIKEKKIWYKCERGSTTKIGKKNEKSKSNNKVYSHQERKVKIHTIFSTLCKPLKKLSKKKKNEQQTQMVTNRKRRREIICVVKNQLYHLLWLTSIMAFSQTLPFHSFFPHLFSKIVCIFVHFYDDIFLCDSHFDYFNFIYFSIFNCLQPKIIKKKFHRQTNHFKFGHAKCCITVPL